MQQLISEILQRAMLKPLLLSVHSWSDNASEYFDGGLEFIQSSKISYPRPNGGGCCCSPHAGRTRSKDERVIQTETRSDVSAHGHRRLKFTTALTPLIPFPPLTHASSFSCWLSSFSFSTLVSCIVPLITVSHLTSILVHQNLVFTITKTSWPDVVSLVQSPQSCWPCRIVLLKGSQCSPQIICDISSSSWCSLYLP